MTLRLSSVALLAAPLTFALFWVMTTLIRVPQVLIGPEPLPRVAFVNVRTPEPVPPKVRRPPPRPEQIEPTPTVAPAPTPVGPGIPYRTGPHNKELDPTDGERWVRPAPGDGDAVPLVRLAPRFPERALRSGTEGRVLVEFSVDRVGRVRNAFVVVAEPPGVFDRAALEAIRGWRYSPRIVNGRAVERTGLRVAIPFRLGDAD